jgi:hypothetical protein
MSREKRNPGLYQLVSEPEPAGVSGRLALKLARAGYHEIVLLQYMGKNTRTPSVRAVLEDARGTL